ncbi:Fc receptor-like protein 5 isoform X1 [Gadus morhua]|uniref:Fc receptor-like protein 5 isoform X1 n=1 Tax=Gadus morhua TaxID=8049 RepID=UPI0011B78972|nr:Fc receptor-like protein 5 isoform X1 [Gadus morhua]
MSALHVSVLLLVLLLASPMTYGYVSGPVSLTVSPSGGQVFEYESLSLGCDPADSPEGSSTWIVWRFTHESPLLSGGLSWCGSHWGESSSTNCLIATSKQSDSGLYWCQSSQGESSSALHINVTGGHVILESPVLPVMEGHNVTVSCRTSTLSPPFSADFYKDGLLVMTAPTARMTIYNVSKSDEGLYKCSVSGLGHSPESWLNTQGAYVPATLWLSNGSQQVFEYQQVTVFCGGSGGGWRVWRVALPAASSMSACGDNWGSPSPGLCHLNFTKKYDTATYWCRSATGQHSNMVNITVHDGPVILESPVLSVMEGQIVTLSCRTKTPSSSFSTFYKDGSIIMTPPTARMTIYNVSKSDEGLYKCSMSGLGESPESWLAVRGGLQASPSEPEGKAEAAWLRTLVWRAAFYLVVMLLHGISTMLLMSVDCSLAAVSVDRVNAADQGLDEEYDDVTQDVTTQHLK